MNARRSLGSKKLIAADEQLAKSLQDAAMVGRGAGDAIGKSLAAAIEKANVDKLLADMRKLGPEGQKAAKAIEQQMAQAGKGGRKSMEQIMEELRKIDPATADIAKRPERISNQSLINQTLQTSLNPPLAKWQDWYRIPRNPRYCSDNQRLSR